MGPAAGIAVVIPVLDAVTTIGSQLDAVLGQDCRVPFEVVVADNGSTDGTVQVVAEACRRDGRLRLVDAAAAPRGGAGAKNLGVRSTHAPLVAFCDADDLVAAGWLEQIHEALLEHHAVSVAREYWSLNPGLPRRFYPESITGVVFYGVPTVSGGAFGVRRADYLEVGGFDEAFAGAVDTDFGLRLYASTRLPPALAPDAVVHCRVPTTPVARFRRYRSLGRSLPLLMEQHAHLLSATRASENRRRARLLAWLVVRLPYVVDPGVRLRWAQSLGSLVGEVEGLAMAQVRRVRRGTASAQAREKRPCAS